MFNLNENNRIVMSQNASDMRAGVNRLCGLVRVVGLEPTNGDVYVFVGRSRKVMKLLHWERGGFVLYYKRLETGRFHPGGACARGWVSARCAGTSWCCSWRESRQGWPADGVTRCRPRGKTASKKTLKKV